MRRSQSHREKGCSPCQASFRLLLRFYNVLLLLLCWNSVVVVVSANGRTNYNAYNYDMAPTFTPDGRLLQVEYASTASERSPHPVVALQWNGNADSDNDNDKEPLVILMAAQPKSSPHHRILILPSRRSGSHISSSPNNQMAVAMTGVLADCLALVQVALQEGLEEFQSYSRGLSVLEFTQSLANACQGHSFGGGLRPFGSTLLVAGMVPTSTSSWSPQLYQTDPSGAIVEASSQGRESSSTSTSSSSLSRHSHRNSHNRQDDGGDKSPQLQWMVGGSPSVQRQLGKKLDTILSASTNKNVRDDTTMEQQRRTVLVQTARALLQEGNKQFPSTSTTTSSSKKAAMAPLTLEVVVLHPTLGCQRITGPPLQELLDEALR